MASELETKLAGQLRRAGGLTATFVQEYKFHPIRQWRADFAWPDQHLLLEVEGATRTGGGRHLDPDGYHADLAKYNAAAVVGWRLLRVSSDMVRDGSAAVLATQALGQNA